MRQVLSSNAADGTTPDIALMNEQGKLRENCALIARDNFAEGEILEKSGISSGRTQECALSAFEEVRLDVKISTMIEIDRLPFAAGCAAPCYTRFRVVTVSFNNDVEETPL